MPCSLIDLSLPYILASSAEKERERGRQKVYVYRASRLNVACLLQLNFHILIGTATWRVPEVTVRIDRLLFRIKNRLFLRVGDSSGTLRDDRIKMLITDD